MDNLNPLLAERAARVAELQNLVSGAETRGKITTDEQGKIDALTNEIRDLDERVKVCQAVRSGDLSPTDRDEDAVALTRERSFAGWYEARHGGFGLAGDGFGSADSRDFSLGKVAAAMAGRIDRRSLSDVE
ncbi:MAG: hypothetical protein QOJ22_1004, partial [Thermoleophilaceae bacterium]|nr:hypothetical protein [Thermoleophilaceae bacterium]